MKRVVETPFPSDSLIASAVQLGEAVRAARTQQGLTIETAALAAGISKDSLCNIEAGRPTVSIGIVLRVAQELGVSLFFAPTRQRERVRKLIRGLANVDA
ncbi:MAG: helix-turn-helix domain-containing protein [Pseudomonadota bacterium]